MEGDISYSIGHKHLGKDITHGGCYTVPNGSKRVRCPGYGTIYEFRTMVGGEIVCNVCGQTYASSGFAGRDGQIGHCDKFTVVPLYTLGCGYEEKEVVREADNADNLADNEQIVSVTITY